MPPAPRSPAVRLHALVDELGEDNVNVRGPFHVAKHALVGPMRTAAKEVASRGIRVNSIHPGPVDNVFQHRIETVATGEGEARAAAISFSSPPTRAPS